VVIMSAPTPPWRTQYTVPDDPTVWIAPTPLDHRMAPRTGKPLTLPARSRVGTAFDLAARLGTAVTLAALLVVTATALGVVDGEPTPTGATSAGR
jgi:hypothetical protein